MVVGTVLKQIYQFVCLSLACGNYQTFVDIQFQHLVSSSQQLLILGLRAPCPRKGACLPQLPSCLLSHLLSSQHACTLPCLHGHLPSCPLPCLPSCQLACVLACPLACFTSCLLALLPTCPLSRLPTCPLAILPVCPLAILPA